MSVTGSPDDLALCGWDGAPGVGFVLGSGHRSQVTGDRVLLLERGDGSSSGRVVAPAGDVWRRMPWPANDALFDLEPPVDAGAVLVVGDRAVADGLSTHGIEAATADRLTLDGLRAAAVVILLAGHGALPAHAFAVLAARRVLIADATEVAFGLQPGIEFLPSRFPEEAVERAVMAARYPEATASLRALGAAAARRHRASVVYPRLADDFASCA